MASDPQQLHVNTCLTFLKIFLKNTLDWAYGHCHIVRDDDVPQINELLVTEAATAKHPKTQPVKKEDNSTGAPQGDDAETNQVGTVTKIKMDPSTAYNL